MTGLSHSTKPLKISEVKRSWHCIDISGKILGRTTPEIAKLLQGKHKANYVPYLDVGDYVVVINAKKLVLTGRKPSTKEYTSYSGYPGGLRRISFKTLIEKDPGKIVEHAVLGMLPKNKLRDQRMKRLYVFPDNKHPYEDKFKNENLEIKT